MDRVGPSLRSGRVTSFPLHFTPEVKGSLRPLRRPLTLLRVTPMKGGDTMDDYLEQLLEVLRLLLESIQEIAASISLLEERLNKK